MKVVVSDKPDFVAGWVAARTGYMPGGKYFAIGLIETDGNTQTLIAGCVFDNWRGHDVVGHIAADRPLSREFIAEIHAFPFYGLGVDRITACTKHGNLPSQDFLKRLGFQLEGVIRRGYPDGEDKLVFGQLREDAQKWLTLKSRRTAGSSATTLTPAL